MLYLSKISLNQRSRKVGEELRNPYMMHQTLSRGFPRLSKEEFRDARVLFRVDNDNNSLFALVQSKVAPDWAALSQIPHYATEVRVTPFDFKPRDGQQLRFRLLANPTFRPFVAPQGKTKKHASHVGLFREYERLDWLLQRARREHGFDLPTHEIKLTSVLKSDGEKAEVPFRGKFFEELELEVPTCQIVDLNDGQRFPTPAANKIPDAAKQFSVNQFSAALFGGVLTVTDAGKFANAVENGIGKARGFGFGLLSVAPLTK